MIEGNKVDLRIITEQDFPEFLNLLNNMKNRGEFWPYYLMTEKRLKKIYDENGMWGDEFGRLLICDKQNNIVGEIFYFKPMIVSDCLEIGYQLFRPEDRGKGIVSEALKLFVDYLFRLKPINRLQVNIVPRNAPSMKVAEKCGFVFEGTLREVFFNRGKYDDLAVLSLLRKEWESGGSQ